jgi:hypothetical protein
VIYLKPLSGCIYGAFGRRDKLDKGSGLFYGMEIQTSLSGRFSKNAGKINGKKLDNILLY